jgi:hypothetical protein
MEAPASRSPFWRVHALIAEARRRARRRWLLIVLLVVVVAGVTAAVVLRPSGGESRSGLSGRVGGTSASSRFVHFGPFVLTVPKGFHRWESLDGLKSKPTLGAFWVALHPRAAGTIQAATGYPASEVFLWVQADAPQRLLASKLPLDLQELHRLPGFAHDGTAWQGILYGGHEGYRLNGELEGYSLMVFEGSKASAADRAAIERALRSIRRAS